MKCYYDNKNAVAICLNCGRSLCKDCVVVKDNKRYCQECTNSDFAKQNKLKVYLNSSFGIETSKFKILSLASITLCILFILYNLFAEFPFMFVYFRYFEIGRITSVFCYLAAFSLLIAGNIFILKNKEDGLLFCFGFLIPLFNYIQNIGLTKSLKVFFVHNFYALIPLILTIISGFILKTKHAYIEK